MSLVQEEKKAALIAKQSEQFEAEAKRLKYKEELSHKISRLGGPWTCLEQIESGLEKLKQIAEHLFESKQYFKTSGQSEKKVNNEREQKNREKLEQKQQKEVSTEQIESLHHQLLFYKNVLLTKVSENCSRNHIRGKRLNIVIQLMR